LTVVIISDNCIYIGNTTTGKAPFDPSMMAADMFDSVKRKYWRRLIVARLAKGAETSISRAFLVMCGAQESRRLLRLFFSLFLLGFALGREPLILG
jgi:hypothetical protein